jgi:hypothetical protein
VGRAEAGEVLRSPRRNPALRRPNPNHRRQRLLPLVSSGSSRNSLSENRRLARVRRA